MFSKLNSRSETSWRLRMNQHRVVAAAKVNQSVIILLAVVGRMVEEVLSQCFADCSIVCVCAIVGALLRLRSRSC